MGKIYTQIINRFDGGLSEDKRVKSSNKFSLTKHFDAFTYPHKLVPYRSTEANEDKTFNIVKFLYAPYVTGHALYGLGVDVGTTKPCLYIYDIDTAFPTTWSGGSWLKSPTTGRNTEVLFYYKNYVYVWAGNGRYLQRVDITSHTNDFSTIANGDFSAAGTVAQPVHHPADDTAYFFYNNKVYKLSGTTWCDGGTDPVLTLPDNLSIVSACAYGNYLAIACSTKGTTDYQSIVFLWDRDSSLTTLSERIDFGAGRIVHLANLAGRLTAVIDYYISGSRGAAASGKIVIRQYLGGQFAATVNEIESDTAGDSTTLPKVRYQKDDKLYFAAKPKLNGDFRHGIWVVDSNGRVTLDYIEEEVADNRSYQGIYQVGNIWFIAHSGDGSVNRTNDQAVYTYTSIYESLILDGNDSSTKKKLLGVSVMTEPLVSNDDLSLVLKYRKDSDLDGSWTTILTRTITNADENSHSAINIESTGVNLPEFNEIQFRIESKSGSYAPVITGLKFQYEVLDNLPY